LIGQFLAISGAEAEGVSKPMEQLDLGKLARSSELSLLPGPSPQDAGGGPSALLDLLLILRADVGVIPPDRSRQPSQWGMQRRHNCP
jgi:hypothetical protein